MNEKLKEIFNQIEAEEELKNSTRVFLVKKTQGYTRIKATKHRYYRYIAACACLLFVLAGGGWLYFTPTTKISIDINPSIELSVNRFGQVVSVNGYNDDGQELRNMLDIKFKNYVDAFNQILRNESIAILLSNNEIMEITVTGKDSTQSSEILSKIKVCTAEQRNTYCYFASAEALEAAHEAGLSYGKYKAFLEIQLLAPEITPEEIRGMTMREIRDFIDRLTTDTDNATQADKDREQGHHGFGNGYGGGRGNGKKGNVSE